jgi:succinate dehydrogenase/fumarate reductase flavoprotein subunit
MKQFKDRIAMKKTTFQIKKTNGDNESISCSWVHTLVIGSGAAGLNAAVQLVRNGVDDVLILTEGLAKGTSINTGSDKQTFYKLSMCGNETDSPRMMADSYLTGGSMHGDLALIEASLSARAFFNLVNLGVPFPRDQYGQFVGYKTDHDPRQRATSIGPYTSREMCRKLIDEVQRLKIPVREGQEVIELITVEEGGGRRMAGAIALDVEGSFEAYLAENVIFAVGGPGGIYRTSVYPAVQFGAIGLALMVGARTRNLQESQFGLASTKFRWNVSGTYMQVIPRFISKADEEGSEEQEFLRPYFASAGEMNGNIFLKGYQWPFDARKVIGGSSLIDLLVYIETMVRGRRVYLDFRNNPNDYKLDDLPEEARNYLIRSIAIQATPFKRLVAMNPGAVDLYREHGIDLNSEPLEIAVCAQHNNGGLAGNIWWESTNIKHLFPVGEVNGSHGVTRSGGSALNSGQVGGFRAAEFIANRYQKWSLDETVAEQAVKRSVQNAWLWMQQSLSAERSWNDILKEVRERMSLAGAHIRDERIVEGEMTKARELAQMVMKSGCRYDGQRDLKNAFRTRQLCYSHALYLQSIGFALQSGTGSRGSSIVLNPEGEKIHPLLDEAWKILPENPLFRAKVLETEVNLDGTIVNEWVDCHPVPEIDSWFETTWADFRKGDIYKVE